MLKIQVITPEKLVSSTEAVEIVIPTENGNIGVRSGHIPLLAPIKPGEIKIKHQGKAEESLVVYGGFVSIANNEVEILADSAERTEDLNEKLIETAIERARKVKMTTLSPVELEKVGLELEINLARLKALNRKKRH